MSVMETEEQEVRENGGLFSEPAIVAGDDLFQFS